MVRGKAVALMIITLLVSSVLQGDHMRGAPVDLNKKIPKHHQQAPGICAYSRFGSATYIVPGCALRVAPAKLARARDISGLKVPPRVNVWVRDRGLTVVLACVSTGLPSTQLTVALTGIEAT